MIAWGPWIEHDGKTAPRGAGEGVRIEVISTGSRAMIHPATTGIDPRWPGFFWRWRRVRLGCFRSEKRRVCHEPAYAPVLRYRIGRPRGLAQMKRLQQIAWGTRPVEGPEGPVRLPEVVE